MSLQAPWTLLGLLLLPLLWWLYQRRPDPATQGVPSLLFLEGEPEVAARKGRPRGLRFLLAVAAVLALVLAASDPLWHRIVRRPFVRVVVSGGAPATNAAYRDRVAKTLERVRAVHGAQGLSVAWLPAMDSSGRWQRMPRPSLLELEKAAREGEASLRIVLSDRVPEDRVPDVAWAGLGDPAARNDAIVAVSVFEENGDTSVFVNVRVDENLSEERALMVGPFAGTTTQRRSLVPHPSGMATATFAGEPAEEAGVRLLSPPGDAIPSDNEVALSRRALAVGVDPALPPAAREAVLDALEAAGPAAIQPPGASSTPNLWIGTAGPPAPEAASSVEGEGPVVLLLEAAGREGRWEAPPASGVAFHPPSALTADLALEGIAWRLAPWRSTPSEQVLLGWSTPEGIRPLLVQADRQLRFLASLTAGSPPLAESAFFPILMSNVLTFAGKGADVGLGFHAAGVLDLETSTPGRAVSPLDLDRVAQARPLRRTEPLVLRVPLLGIALLVLLALWCLESPLGRRVPLLRGPALARRAH